MWTKITQLEVKLTATLADWKRFLCEFRSLQRAHLFLILKDNAMPVQVVYPPHTIPQLTKLYLESQTLDCVLDGISLTGIKTLVLSTPLLRVESLRHFLKATPAVE
jgi:hypothetical protein